MQCTVIFMHSKYLKRKQAETAFSGCAAINDHE